MSAQWTGIPDPNNPPPELTLLLETPKPWFVSLIGNLKELISPTPQQPLQVSFKPLSEEDLKNSNDPSLVRLAAMQAEEKGWFGRLSSSLKDLFSNEKLPELQVTSRPLTQQELEASGSSLAYVDQTAVPWYKTFIPNLKEMLFPAKLPPLQVTSQPVKVREIFGKDQYKSRSQGISVLVHVGVIALLFGFGASQIVPTKQNKTETIFDPVDIAPYVPQPIKKQAGGGGGGGGDRSPLPASKGRLPKASLKQFTPPVAVINNPNPKLVMEPTVIVPPDVNLPQVNMAQFGDPFAKMGPPSNGTGSGGGIGSGSGGGVGSGRGGGVGPGEGGGFGGGVYRIGGGVSAPQPIFKVEPEYSEEARKAKFQGTVLLAIVVDTDGHTKDIRVIRSLGMGLDEKAIEAVSKWRFRPGMKDGKPVPVRANVEVNFRLL